MKQFALTRLNIRSQHLQEMQNHVDQNLPYEACGLLAAAGGISQAVLPISNTLHSAGRFFMEPHELLAAFELIDAHTWELQAVFHSHPNGPKLPSTTDLEEYSMPDVPALIWYRPQAELEPSVWNSAAYLITSSGYQKLALRIVE
jgi:proteasome lid subunit RPN8/RPN11